MAHRTWDTRENTQANQWRKKFYALWRFLWCDRAADFLRKSLKPTFYFLVKTWWLCRLSSPSMSLGERWCFQSVASSGHFTEEMIGCRRKPGFTAERRWMHVLSSVTKQSVLSSAFHWFTVTLSPHWGTSEHVCATAAAKTHVLCGGWEHKVCLVKK